ncbi:hypothetical protein J3E69DRAFT_344735, partial [Trichoderma sp. SZMC 28015]
MIGGKEQKRKKDGDKITVNLSLLLFFFAIGVQAMLYEGLTIRDVFWAVYDTYTVSRQFRYVITRRLDQFEKGSAAITSLQSIVQLAITNGI